MTNVLIAPNSVTENAAEALEIPAADHEVIKMTKLAALCKAVYYSALNGTECV